MAVFKCPKCNELFIEKRQMLFCPSCSYNGKLIEMRISESDDEKQPRFNSRKTLDKAIVIIESKYKQKLNETIKFTSQSFPRAQTKLKRLFKTFSINTWQDLINFNKEFGLKEMKGMGPYIFASLAHLLCQTFMIEEVYA